MGLEEFHVSRYGDVEIPGEQIDREGWVVRSIGGQVRGAIDRRLHKLLTARFVQVVSKWQVSRCAKTSEFSLDEDQDFVLVIDI